MSRSFEINKYRDPQVIYPSQIIEKKYVGELKGYYVQSTNSYNVLPFDKDANVDEKKVYSIGFILPVNPFFFVDKEIASQIKYLKTEELTPNETVEKIQQALLLASKDIKSQESLRIETSKFINEFYPKIINEIETHEYATSINEYVTGKYDDVRHRQLKEDVYCSSAKEWLQGTFVKALCGDYDKMIFFLVHKSDMDASIARDSVIGYWENEELHFVQLKTRKECKQEKYSLKLDVFSRNTGILESDIMLKKGALFIGCGSVGSLFALELAKAGVGRFLLVDNDIFGYHNICRHQCGIYDVGRYKTDALKECILQVNPYAEVVTKNMTIQDVPIPELLAFCDKNTIVVGGADNREGDLYANNIAQQIEMPFMSIGCWERAFAGEIFYCLPHNMPNYQDFIEVSGLLSARVSQNRRFYTTEEELAKISFEPGISVDINFVTIIAVKLALDILNIGNEKYTQRLLPHLTQYTLVCNTNSKQIGGDTAEIFSYPLQVTTSITVPYSKK